MKKTPTYEELLAENIAMKAEAEAMKANEISLKARIAYLERLLYGSKSDRIASKVPDNQPGLLTRCSTRPWMKRPVRSSRWQGI